MEIKELKLPARVEPNLEVQGEITQPEASVKTTVSFKDKVPAHWTIVETESGVYCVNSNSREIFTGSLIEFNRLIKE